RKVGITGKQLVVVQSVQRRGQGLVIPVCKVGLECRAGAQVHPGGLENAVLDGASRTAAGAARDIDTLEHLLEYLQRWIAVVANASRVKCFLQSVVQEIRHVRVESHVPLSSA